MTSTIKNIQKQNDSMYGSLIARNIQFDRIEIPNDIDEQEQLKLLNDENVKLKEIVKNNKPKKNIVFGSSKKRRQC